MRILLAHNSLYAGSFGGGDKSNRLLMEALAARGHTVRVVARLERFSEEEARVSAGGAVVERVSRAVINGVEVHTLLLEPRIRQYFAEQIAGFDPNIIITSTDDPAQMLFEVGVRAPRGRVVHLVRATIGVPFGPDSSMKSAARTALLRQADLVVGVSEYVAGYVQKWGEMDAVHVPISLMEPREWPATGRFDNRYVTLVNPCAVKGIDIFVELAGRMPHLEFAAVPTWGTNAGDAEKLRRHPNIHVLQPVANIDVLLEQTRVMLVPSVWAEARSRMVVEAMLGGVPVVASDIGGIPEAKLGVPYLVPVKPLIGYESAVDENMVPIARVPVQDLRPWETALARLTTDREHWNDIAHRSRAAALDYAGRLSVEPFERLLLNLQAKPKRRVTASMSAGRKKLLDLWLKQRAWFPNADATKAPFRLFCFPHAGGGTLTYRSWAGQLGDGIAVCPALLPGRESRLHEPPVESIEDLVASLAPAIRPLLDGPYALFGHSMGAGIAFELARSLRRAGLRMPRVLIVSGARAPQFRLNWKPGPEPSDDDLLEQLRRLEGLPDDASLQLALPLLRADARLYRNYVYEPEQPLDVPLIAYGGAEDPNVGSAHLEAWREQTTAEFTRREFPGGHFYLKTNQAAFLEALRADLQAGVTGDS